MASDSFSCRGCKCLHFGRGGGGGGGGGGTVIYNAEKEGMDAATVQANHEVVMTDHQKIMAMLLPHCLTTSMRVQSIYLQILLLVMWLQQSSPPTWHYFAYNCN